MRTNRAALPRLLSCLIASSLATFSDFDSAAGLAGWSVSGTQQWTLRAGATPSNPTGPTSGASGSSSDQYYFLETSPGQAGDAGTLRFNGSGVSSGCNVTATFW